MKEARVGPHSTSGGRLPARVIDRDRKFLEKFGEGGGVWNRRLAPGKMSIS